MRVGVLLGDAPAEVGGGFTFQWEVLDQLFTTAGESPHRFVILDAPARLRRSTLPPNIELPKAPPALLDRVFRLAPDRYLNWLVTRHRINVVWSLWPTHPIPDAPFVTIVWDLQHRLQPFFPEVSAGGEWAARERDYSVRLRRAAVIIAGTETGRREIVTFYQIPEQRVHVLPHPTPRFALEAAASSAGALARFKLTEGFLLYPAQFWSHKNHVNLLLALKRLKDQGLLLPLVLVGADQGNAAAIQRLVVELDLTKQVRFLGFVSLEELVALYRGALCLAYVTLFGPENLPPLEAFALGCPVVASDVPGAREQLGDAALLIDATQPALIADALRRIHSDATLRADLATRGRERALRWTGRHFVRGVFGILDNLEPYVRCWTAERER